MFTVQAPEIDPAPRQLATAEDAIEAVNRLRARRVGNVIIRDDAGVVLSERQLAMLVMDTKLKRTREAAASQKLPPRKP